MVLKTLKSQILVLATMHSGNGIQTLTSQSGSQSVIVSVQQTVQDLCEQGDVVFKGVCCWICTHKPAEQRETEMRRYLEEQSDWNEDSGMSGYVSLGS